MNLYGFGEEWGAVADNREGATGSVEARQRQFTARQGYGGVVLGRRDDWRGKSGRQRRGVRTSQPAVWEDSLGLLSHNSPTFPTTSPSSTPNAVATADPNVFSFNVMFDAYAKASLPLLAHQIFDKIPEPDLISYNTLIAAYAECGDPLPALKLFSGMRKSGLGIDGFTFSTVISACCDDIGLIKQLHSLALSGGFNGYASVSNTLISGVRHAQQKEGSKALELYRETVHYKLYIDISTLASVLNAFTSMEDLLGGMQFHGQLIKMGFHQYNYKHVGSGLIDLYAKCRGHMLDCEKVFQEMHDPDLVLWNTMISGYSLYDEFSEEALNCFKLMQ
ncbi:hypothetical protein ACS0TY_029242 [Phlomoides rotata]